MDRGGLTPPTDPYEELRAVLEDRDYLILDTETTGLDRPELVSLAAVNHRGETLFNEYVRPGKPIEPGATALTGITNEAVRDRPAYPTFHEAIVHLLTGRRVVIYNAAFDLAVLENTAARYSLVAPSFAPWCAMRWFSRVYGQWDPVRSDYTWQRLAVAADYFGIAPGAAHDALGDCLTTWRFLEGALARARAARPNMDRLL